MAKEHKCLLCGDGYTEADLRRLRGLNEPYLLFRGKGGKFLCPTCYEEFVTMSSEEQDAARSRTNEILGRGGKK